MATVSSSVLTRDFWEKQMDPRVQDMVFMTEAIPKKLILICFVYFIIVKILRPTFKSPNFSPVLFILNGLSFGIHGLGIFILLALTNNGKDVFDCTHRSAILFTNEMTYDYVKSEAAIHAGILLMMIKVFLLLESVLLVLMGNHLSNWRIAAEVYFLITGGLIMKYYSRGPLFYFIGIYIATYTFLYAYNVLKLGYSEGQGLLKNLKTFFVYFKFLMAILLLAHYLFLVFSSTCKTNPMMLPLSFIELFYALGLFLSTMSDYKKAIETATKH